ncbi:hypothetical protein ACWEQL_38060 [Kitasatospora sp. NPDC004240]
MVDEVEGPDSARDEGGGGEEVGEQALQGLGHRDCAGLVKEADAFPTKATMTSPDGSSDRIPVEELVLMALGVTATSH